MKVLLLYRPNSEHARIVENFARDFGRFHVDKKIDLMSLDTRDGSSTASLYDVLQFPAILALSDDGQLLRVWVGDNLPLIDEVAYYSSQNNSFLQTSSI